MVGDVTLNGRGGPKRRREGGGGGGRGGEEVERLSMMSLTTPVPGGDARKGVHDLGEGGGWAYQEQGKGWNTSTAILSRFKHRRPRAVA